MQKSYIEFDIESLQTLNIETFNKLSNEKYFFIGVNPFSHSAWASFTLQNYLKIIANLCAIKNVIVIVVSYGEFHDRLINALSDFKDSSAFQRLAILKNNGDILNLAELISRLSLLISPSSGPIHIATNLLIPTIGIYSKEDTTKWATRDKRYVILSKDTNNITESENTAAMQSVIDITQNLITQNALIARSFNEEVFRK